MTGDDFADKMEQIAIKLADEMLAGEAPAEQVDAFKALSLYLVQTRKLGRKKGDMDELGFGAIKKAITEGNRTDD